MTDTITSLEALTPSDLDAGTVFSGTPSGKIVNGACFIRKRLLRYIFGLVHVSA